MANNYCQFSEVIDGITSEEAAWIRSVLQLDTEEQDQWEELRKLLAAPKAELEFWPDFGWDLEDKDTSLWLYSEEGANTENLALFVKAFFKKFRPTAIFKATGADWCSKLRVGEFGGWWLVVTSTKIYGGSTWCEASKTVDKIIKRREKKHGPKRKPRRAASHSKARPRR